MDEKNKLDDDAARYAETRALGDTDFEEGVPKWGNARFNARMNLVVTVRHTKTRFVFDANQIEEIMIGRHNPDTNETPQIDLENDDGLDKGVSRRHAAIVRRDGALQVVDLGSPNGTYLNGQKLVPNQPRVLRDGDDLRLAYLVLHVKFDRLTDN